MTNAPHPHTRVVHVNDPDGWDVYIGRQCGRAKDPRCRKRSVFANPFRVGEGGCTSVEHCLETYERHMRAELAKRPGLVEKLLALRGRRLACWCRPDPCHGDVLVRLIEEEFAGREGKKGT